MPAPKGNRNALKHGLYARHYPDEVKKKLLHWEVDDFIAEIQLLRVSMDRIAGRILLPTTDDDLIIKQNNSLSGSVCSLVRASSQHVLFNSKESPVLVAWFDTLNTHEFFIDGEIPA